MNHLRRLGLMVLLSLLFGSTAVAGQWEDYSKFMDRFYSLEQQEFDRVSCRIVLSTLDDILSSIRTQFKPLGDKIEIIENVSEFALSFDRSSGLSFNLPLFDVRIISEEGIRDRGQVERGIKYMKDGFQMQIDGATQMIQGLFEGYVTPKERDYSIKEMSVRGNEVKIIYEKGGNEFTDIYSNNECNSTMIMPSGRTQSRMQYVSVGKKLSISSAKIQLNQAGMTANTDVSVEYKDLKGIVFPSRIITKNNLIMDNMEQNTQLEILFADCEVEGKKGAVLK